MCGQLWHHTDDHILFIEVLSTIYKDEDVEYSLLCHASWPGSRYKGVGGDAGVDEER